MKTPRHPLLMNRRAAMQAGAAGLTLAGFPLDQPAAQGTAELPDLIGQWAAGWSNLGDPAALLALVTETIVYEDVAAGDLVEGAAAFEQLLTEAHSGIPDFTITLDTAIVGEGHAAAEYSDYRHAKRPSAVSGGDAQALPAEGGEHLRSRWSEDSARIAVLQHARLPVAARRAGR